MIGAGRKEFDVNIQDQTTEPINDYFLQSISNFSLVVDTGVSGTTNLIFTFTAAVGHLLIVGKELILLDVASDRSLYAVVVGVAGDDITIDRPIDHDFKSVSTLGRITTSQMNVAGSQASPQIFSVRAGSIPQDFTKFKITMTDNSAMDDEKFGGLAALTNGLVFRINNSFQKTIFTFKKNGDFAQYGATKYPDKVPAGTFAFNASLDFGGQNQRGVVLRISDTDVLQWIVTDDLSAGASFRISAIGHKTKGET